MSPCPECKEKDYHAESCSMFRGTDWVGDPPEHCDVCTTKIEEIFVDGKTRNGPWAVMCPVCALLEGVGLGEGKGQLYIRTVHSGFVKRRG